MTSFWFTIVALGGHPISFRDFQLDKRLLGAIAKAGYDAPTPIQEATIPLVLANHDVIATAQTGTGKTAAFVLPILNKLLAGPRRRTRVLILTPTRELAEQINDTIRTFGHGTGIRSATVYGGVGHVPQIKALQSGVEIVVACPGRLLDHIRHRQANLGQVDMLVLDEADRMFDMGFLPDVRRILSHLPAPRQTLLFSATFPLEIERLAAQNMTDPQRIAIGLSRPAHTVTHALFPVTQHLKTKLLLALLGKTDAHSVLVFARTKHRAKRLAEQIDRAGYTVTSLHGNRSQLQRQSALNGFKSGEYQIMVATDIGARGLDVQSISHVINYDIPDTADAYIHRIGRTGRAERTGDAFTFVSPEDSIMVRTLEKIMGQALPRQVLEDFDYTVPMPAHQAPARKGPKRIPIAPGSPVVSHERRNSNHGASRPKNRPGIGSGATPTRHRNP